MSLPKYSSPTTLQYFKTRMEGKAFDSTSAAEIKPLLKRVQGLVDEYRRQVEQLQLQLEDQRSQLRGKLFLTADVTR